MQDLFRLQQLLCAPVLATQHHVQRRLLVLAQLLQLLQLRLSPTRLAHRRLCVLQQRACLQYTRLHVPRRVQLRLPEGLPRLLLLPAQEQHTRALRLTPPRHCHLVPHLHLRRDRVVPPLLHAPQDPRRLAAQSVLRVQLTREHQVLHRAAALCTSRPHPTPASDLHALLRHARLLPTQLASLA